MGNRLAELGFVETHDEFRMDVELPGVEPEGVEVTVTNGHLVIRGENRGQHQQRRRGYWAERYYGSFYRAVPLSDAVDQDRVEARFARGLLTIHLPKTKDSRRHTKPIPVRGS